MNNKYIYIIVLVVVIILGGIYFYYQKPVEPKPLGVEIPAVGMPTVTAGSITNATSGTASAVLANTKVVTWQTKDYPANVGVNINLLKKISDSPAKFTKVRVVAIDTPNDGEETMVLQSGEDSKNFYVEVACSSTYQFNEGCKLSRGALEVN